MPDLEHLHPVLRQRVEAVGHPVYSGARSHRRQAELRKCYLDRKATGVCRCPDGCNTAAPPGWSWHEYDEAIAWPPDPEASALVGGPWAMAVDLTEPSTGWGSPAGRAIHARCRAVGLDFYVDGEPWHAQPAEIRETGRTPDAWRRLPPPGAPPPPPDPWADLFGPVLLRSPAMARITARQDRADAATGHRIYDISHVWPNGHVSDGVRFGSFVGVRAKEMADVVVTVWRGSKGGRQTIKWGPAGYSFANDEPWALVSVMCNGRLNADGKLDESVDVPLDVFWELTPGKAP